MTNKYKINKRVAAKHIIFLGQTIYTKRGVGQVGGRIKAGKSVTDILLVMPTADPFGGGATIVRCPLADIIKTIPVGRRDSYPIAFWQKKSEAQQ